MTRNDLEQAASANSELKTAERHLEALLSDDFKVTAITIDRGDGGLNPITLQKGCGGTGSISSIGFTDGLKEAMTKALYDHFRDRVKKAQSVLESLGINVAY